MDARPIAIVHQVVHSTEGGDSFHCCPKRFVIVVLLPNRLAGEGLGCFLRK